MDALEIGKLARRLQLRQQAQATAQIFVKRFYLKVEIRWTNPYLVLATALYLAGKMEECPQHIRVIMNEARNAWPGMFPLQIFNISCREKKGGGFWGQNRDRLKMLI